MNKSIEGGASGTTELEEGRVVKPESQGGFWDSGLDRETARHEAHKDSERMHESEIQQLGNKELARLREKGEIGLEELTPEKTQQLIKQLGDQVFHHMKVKEAQERRLAQENEEAAKEKERRRREMIQQIEDKQPWNRFKKWFKDNWVSDRRKY